MTNPRPAYVYDADTDTLIPIVGSSVPNPHATSHSAGSTDPLQNLVLTPTAADQKPLVVKGAATQSANLQDWQDSTGTVLACATASGGLVVNESGAAAGDFRVESDTEENMLLVDADADTDGAVYLGGSTNGIKVNKGGKLSFLGTATWFDDLRVAPNARTTGVNAPTFERYQRDSGGTSNGIYAYSFDDASVEAQKEIFFTMQMPHGKLLGSNIHLHIHWCPKTAGTSGNQIKWGLEYSWVNLNEPFPVTTTIYADTVTYGSIDTALSHCLTEFPDISPPANETISSILWARLFRFSSDSGDTATITAGLLFIDAHVEMCRLGSNDEFQA